MEKITKNTIILAISLIIVIGIGVFFARSGAEKDRENEELKKQIEEMEKKRVHVDAIKEEVKRISQYCAYEYNYTDVITYTDQNEFKGIKIPWTDNKFIATIEGKVNIGIDGEKIKISETEDSEGKITSVTVSVPQSEIMDNYTDPASLKIYDEKSGLFNPVKVEDYNELLVEAKKKGEKKVKESDTLKKSDEVIEYMLKSHFQAIYGSDVKINYVLLDETQ